MASNYSITVDVLLNTSSVQSQVNGLNTSLNGVGSAGSAAGAAMGLTFQEANLIMSKSLDIIESMTEQVYTLDRALTEFKKVSSLSGQALENYVNNLGAVGQTVGRTASEMVEAATEFKRNSFNEQDSAALATVAATFQNVSDKAISASDAAGFIISQLKAFHLEAEKATEVIDIINEVAATQAVTTNDLSNAMEVAGAGLATYGNDYQQVVALVTAGTEIMVGRSQQVARGLNTIAARITKNEDALAKYNISIYETDGSLRSTYDVLQDIADIWNTVSDAERVALGQTLAG